MHIQQTSLEGVIVIEPQSFSDNRGFFLESYQRRRYASSGVDDEFVQDNQSRSLHGVLRGLHFQVKNPQAKLVTVISGAIFDVAVDLRTSSPTFARWVGIRLSDEGPRQIYIPAGFAHGFCVLSQIADVHYRTDKYYDPADESGLLWSDPHIGVSWPIKPALVSPRDAALPCLQDIPALPHVTKR